MNEFSFHSLRSFVKMWAAAAMNRKRCLEVELGGPASPKITSRRATITITCTAVLVPPRLMH